MAGYIQLPVRTSADLNNAADVNLLMATIQAVAEKNYQTLTTDLTLTSSSLFNNVIDPNGAVRNVTLPSSVPFKGFPVIIRNTSPTYVITIKASNASTKTTVLNGWIMLEAQSLTPTAPTDWVVIQQVQDWVAWTPTFNDGGVSGKTSAQVWGASTFNGSAYRYQNGFLFFHYQVTFGTGTNSSNPIRFELPQGWNTVVPASGITNYFCDGKGFINNAVFARNYWPTVPSTSQNYFNIAGNASQYDGLQNYINPVSNGWIFQLSGTVPCA
jgi:hypothetical protein